jgi:hypothetical protein
VGPPGHDPGTPLIMRHIKNFMINLFSNVNSQLGLQGLCLRHITIASFAH